jgi:uncharacterized protein
MFIDINEIASEGLRFDEPVAIRPAEGTRAEGVTVLEARLSGAARPGGRGVELNARLDARVRLECSRCLDPFETVISTDFSLTLVPDAAEFGVGEARVRDEDISLFYATEGKVSLAEISAEQIHLSLPLKPVCNEGCQGLCPTCGANKNRIECGCRNEEIDPRLAPLLEFKRRTDGA